jgi:hypothetical protein
VCNSNQGECAFVGKIIGLDRALKRLSHENEHLSVLAVFFAAFCLSVAAVAQTMPTGAAVDAEVRKMMTGAHAKGMAFGVIDRGKVGYVQAYGIRYVKEDPLTKDTVMCGASLTKTVFAYMVMQLIDQGKLNLDTPLKDDLDKAAAELWPGSGVPGQVWPVSGSGRRSALGEDHAAHVLYSFHRL